MAEDNRRDDIAAAMEAAEAPAPEPAESAPAAEVVADTPIGDAPQQELPGIGETAQQKADRERDEKGRFLKKEGSAPEKVLTKAEEPKKEAVPAPPPQPEIKQEAHKFRPPVSWKATAREHWDKLTPDVQQEVIRREREITQGLQEAADARQFRQKATETFAPYEPMFRAQGVDAIQAAETLFRTYAALSTAPPPNRAQLLAGLIQQFLPGKEGLELLDQTLAGQAGNIAAAPAQPAVYRDPRVDELYAQVERAKQAQEQVYSQKAEEAIADVENEEFFWDVKDIMADILEVASKNRLPLDVKTAYNRAVTMHPEVSKVVEQRKAAASSNGSAQRSKLAASSVRSTPASGISAPDQPKDLRSEIEAAWNAVNERSR